jgi:hypothetical protein
VKSTLTKVAVKAASKPSAPSNSKKQSLAASPLSAKPPLQAPLKTAIPPVKAAKVVMAVKPKLVRDSFTMPKDEYLVISELKDRLTNLKQPAKKSELLRAGIKSLAAMSDAVLKKSLLGVPAVKTGRPAKKK